MLNGVRFLGCTLWTDFLLLGSETESVSRRRAESEFSDYTNILMPENERLLPLTSEQSIAFFRRSLSFLKESFNMPFQGRTVVITHHAPSLRSISVNYKKDSLSPSFASKLDELIQRFKPKLWIHGHTHFNVDYQIGPTRIVSNQRGYIPSEPASGFNAGMVIDI